MQQSGHPIQNFGRNVEFIPKNCFQPKSVDEILGILRTHKGNRIRVGGRLHAWSEAAVAEEVYLDLKHLDSVEVQRSGVGNFVTVGAGCQVKKLLNELSMEGLTLPSVGLIDEQTIAGATATGTHGSGKHSLSHYIESAQIAHYDSETGEPRITTVDSGPELKAARCSLGLLGVIIALKFKCRSSYRIKEHMEKYSSLKKVLDAEKRFPLQQFYLVPWSWDFYGQHRVESNEPKSKSAAWYHVYWSMVVDWGLHVVIFALAKLIRANAAIRFFFKRILPWTIVRNWKVVDDSHKMLVMEHELFRHIEIEMFVTRPKLPEAIDGVIDTIAFFGGQPSPAGRSQNRLSSGDNSPKPSTLRDAKNDNDSQEAKNDSLAGSYCHHYPICIRRVLADETLISMSSPSKADTNQDWYAISLISYHWPSQRKGFFDFANYLARSMAVRFGARAHWGKYNPLTGEENGRLYPNLSEFNSIRKKFDPEGRFENNWLAKVIPPNW